MNQRLVKINPKMKRTLDEMYEENSNITADRIKKQFNTEWVNVSHVGSFPAEHAEEGEQYADRMEFMMANDGMTPEDYYDDWYIPQKAAEALAKFYKEFDGRNRSIEEMIRFLNSEEALEFANVKRIRLNEISGRAFTIRGTGIHPCKPRCYRVTLIDEPQRYDSHVYQPDSRKNMYYTRPCSGRNLVVVSPWKAVEY